ncbi:MAG: hypothetical protein C0599_18465 [Salinivirgaceae bacterium]|nr:MAG: hypothetical protein C0599_18465 [Salinivirgaceae bacterium]
MLKFHFKRPLKDELGNTILNVFPGVDKVWVITNENTHEHYGLFEFNKQNNSPQFISNVDINSNATLNSKHYYRWISLAETPLKTDKQARTQFNIFDEYQNRILHLYLPPINDDFILFYIFFNDEQSLTGPNSDSRLTTDNKQLIAHSLYHLLNYERKKYMNDNAVSQNLQKMQQRMSNVHQQSSLNDFFDSFVHDYIEEIGKENQIKVDISEKALKYLSEQPLKPTEVKNLINEVVAWLINFGDINQQRYTIEVSHVVSIRSNTENQTVVIRSKHDTRYNRTFDLLEKLEQAASRTIQKGQKLTGTNVGGSYDTPITAPAITDALKKHASKIITLSSLYPDRWPIIRSQFKPFQNILETNSEFDSAIQSA